MILCMDKLKITTPHLIEPATPRYWPFQICGLENRIILTPMYCGTLGKGCKFLDDPDGDMRRYLNNIKFVQKETPNGSSRR